ncbi:transposase [Aphanothece microscopica]|uniref:transposase n=2 Tax=Aphanothece TaxID=1121 RepID=UPI003CE579EF
MPVCRPTPAFRKDGTLLNFTPGALMEKRWRRSMRRYSEAVKADVKRRMSPPQRESVARISEELGIHLVTLYNWRKTWRLQGEVVPASEKEPEGWSAADKFTVVLKTAGLNDTELGAYCRERGLFPEQVSRWRQAATDANAAPLLSMAEQKELERLRAQDQREIKALKKELQRKEKALAEAAALLVLRKKWEAFCLEDAEG